MTNRQVAVYYAWSRPGEKNAPLSTIEHRFPALYESRRMLYPRLQEFADPMLYDQSIGGFLDHILKPNFAAFVEQTRAQTGHSVIEIERVTDDGGQVLLDAGLLSSIDTLIVISFDSFRTGQAATAGEVSAVKTFLENPDHLLFVCPHHDVGDVKGMSETEKAKQQEAQFLHHGDHTLPPQQGFGGFARSLLAGLEATAVNQFGLHPLAQPDGTPAPIEIEHAHDRHQFLKDVTTFNLHPHLPHFVPNSDSAEKFDVLARQTIDPKAPPHPFTQNGRWSFDALLQSRSGVFAGTILVGDATLCSSTAGGIESLKKFWSNLVQRPSAA